MENKPEGSEGSIHQHAPVATNAGDPRVGLPETDTEGLQHDGEQLIDRSSRPADDPGDNLRQVWRRNTEPGHDHTQRQITNRLPVNELRNEVVFIVFLVCA